MTPEQALSTVNRLIDRQAYTMGMTDLYLLSSALYAALIVAVWLAKPLKMSPPSPSAPVAGGVTRAQRTV